MEEKDLTTRWQQHTQALLGDAFGEVQHSRGPSRGYPVAGPCLEGEEDKGTWGRGAPVCRRCHSVAQQESLGQRAPKVSRGHAGGQGGSVLGRPHRLLLGYNLSFL